MGRVLFGALLLGSTSGSNVVMEGYDVVAYHYFTSNSDKGVQGSSDIVSTHNSAFGNYSFYFSTTENKELFDSDPWAYAPKYGGF